MQYDLSGTGPGKFQPKIKSPKTEKAPNKGKKDTKWDGTMFNDGKGPSKEEIRGLDRTVGKPVPDEGYDPNLNDFVPNPDAVGTSSQIGAMDHDESDEETLISDIDDNKGAKHGIWSTLTSLVGSKQLTEADVEPVINKMRDHLIGKNVASEVADKLCQSVASKLEGKVLGKLTIYFHLLL